MKERNRLKCGGKKRRKAIWGEAIVAGATLAAAGINSAATAAAAKENSKAMIDNAKTQAETIAEQTRNNDNLHKETLAFNREQNEENRQVMKDIQASLQMQAGQANLNDRLEANKMQLKYGGNPTNRFSIAPALQFKVTDGGGVIPHLTTSDGYGLYEIYGNDHNHYHKTKNGKSKTGVGIKFNDGSVVEGEGNQNSNQGELFYITPDEAKFISKHSIRGFNPAKAVMHGVHPDQAFAIQEVLKNVNGIKDDGSSSKRKTRYTRSSSSPVERNRYTQSAKYGTRIQLKCGGRKKAGIGTYTGAIFNATGNLGGAAISTIGNMYAGRKMADAYNQAGAILSDAYSKMHGIDLNDIKRDDYAAPKTLAVIRDPNVNINPQLERINRDAAAERREINRSTLSSAVRNTRLVSSNDRKFQRMSEQYANAQNIEEQIKQANANAITEVAKANADREVQARKNWADQRLSVLQYNNSIENAKIAGMAQSRADALAQSNLAMAQAAQTSGAAFGNALTSAAQGFGTASDNALKTRKEDIYSYAGLSTPEQKALVMTGKTPEEATHYYNQQMNNYKNSSIAANKKAALDEIKELIKLYPNLNFSLPYYTGKGFTINSPFISNRDSIRMPNALF